MIIQKLSNLMQSQCMQCICIWHCLAFSPIVQKNDTKCNTGKRFFTNRAKNDTKCNTGTSVHWKMLFQKSCKKWHKAVKSATVRWYTLHTETKKMVLVPIPVLELYQNHCKAFLKFIKMSYCYRARYILVRWYDAFFIFCWAQQEYLGS